MSFDWKGLLGNVAPVIGTAIGGPFGALAGAAVKLALGLPEESDEKAIAKAMEKATPEQLLALQNAERQFKLDMEKLNVDVMKIDAEDRHSARSREIAVKDATPKVLATIIVGGWIGLNAFIFGGGEINAGSMDIILRTMGTIDAVVGMAVSYYFGTSNSSRAKDQLLYNSIPAK